MPPSNQEGNSTGQVEPRTDSPLLRSAKLDDSRLTLKAASLSPSLRKRRTLSPGDSVQRIAPGIKRDPEDKNAEMPSLSMASKFLACAKKNVNLAGDINAEVINHYIDVYFSNTKSCNSQRLHHEGFLHWFDTAKTKTHDSLMIVHAMLAIGTAFSTRPERHVDGLLFSDITRRAIEEHPDRRCAQVAQTRLMLALYYMASGFPGSAWELAASELPAALDSSIEDGYEKEVKGVG